MPHTTQLIFFPIVTFLSGVAARAGLGRLVAPGPQKPL
jgi:hypothetical protein